MAKKKAKQPKVSKAEKEQAEFRAKFPFCVYFRDGSTLRVTDAEYRQISTSRGTITLDRKPKLNVNCDVVIDIKN